MARRSRLHIPGGTYYVLQRGGFHRPIFSHCDDYSLFERLLTAALRRADARVHAYCWMPDEIHLVLQINEVAVGRIMQSLTGRYARAMQKRLGESGHFFQQRYRALLIDPAAYLLPLVRYLHDLPVEGGLCLTAEEYSHSSHAAYTHAYAIPWLTTRTVFRLLKEQGPAHDYAELMASRPTMEERHLFTHGGEHDARLVGQPEFLSTLPRCARPYRTRASLEDVIQTVTCRMGVDRARVLSNSRERELTLARALIGWYATERRVATLSEVARRLSRDLSTLSKAISRYRRSRPELFQLAYMQDVSALVPDQMVERTAELVQGSGDGARKRA